MENVALDFGNVAVSPEKGTLDLERSPALRKSVLVIKLFYSIGTLSKDCKVRYSFVTSGNFLPLSSYGYNSFFLF